MPWVWEQRNGRLLRDGKLRAFGYSGHAGGKNDPAQERVPRVGPIPAGAYDISLPYDTTEHGPFVLRLTPVWPDLMWGRSGFLIHGDSAERTGEVSLGCIVIPRPAREAIHASGDRHLLVIP